MVYFGISAICILISLVFLVSGKLNLWIDMTGWIQMEYSHSVELNITEIQSEISELATTVLYEWENAINSTSVYSIAGENTLVVVGGFYTTIPDMEAEVLKNNFRASVGDLLIWKDSSLNESKYINIGKSFGDYIRNTAFLTLAIAIVAIALYVVWAFSGVVSGISVVSFGLITIVTLFHDVLISTGLYVIAGKMFTQFQIDTFFVTALLTILGYSINDTIVVFDRIRSNLKQFAWKKGKAGKNLEEIVNLSVSETLTRSIYTSLTLLFVLITIFIFGPESISGFVLVMIFGTIIGTYSSIFIASPLLYQVNKNNILSVYEKKEINPEDKIVV